MKKKNNIEKYFCKTNSKSAEISPVWSAHLLGAIPQRVGPNPIPSPTLLLVVFPAILPVLFSGILPGVLPAI